MNKTSALITYRYFSLGTKKWHLDKMRMEFDNMQDLSPDNVWRYIYDTLENYNINVDELELISCEFDYE